MTFKLDWHPYKVAVLWPPGSVVLVRMAMNKESSRHAYFVVNNWQPKLQAFDLPKNEFVLLEETQQK